MLLNIVIGNKMHFLSNSNQQMIYLPKHPWGKKTLDFDDNLIAYFSTSCLVEVIYGKVFIINRINWNSTEIVSLIGGICKIQTWAYKCFYAWSKPKIRLD